MDEQALRDGHVWENEQSLVQINQYGKGFIIANFKVLDGVLSYTDSVIYKDEAKLLSLLRRLNMKPTNKVITLCRSED
jgi:hypothetical protein